MIVKKNQFSALVQRALSRSPFNLLDTSPASAGAPCQPPPKSTLAAFLKTTSSDQVHTKLLAVVLQFLPCFSLLQIGRV